MYMYYIIVYFFKLLYETLYTTYNLLVLSKNFQRIKIHIISYQQLLIRLNAVTYFIKVLRYTLFFKGPGYYPIYDEREVALAVGVR